MKRIALILGLCLSASAQVPFSPVNTPVFRAFDANAKPLAGGLLFSFAAGTTTPLATYTDATGITPNTNPVVLDSTGQAKVFMGPGTYKFVLQNSLGVQQWTVDQIQGAQASSGVTSFNGRDGIVVPAIGDYDCTMVTGAVCSVATPFYQTVQVSGTAAAQEAALNLKPGTGITITAADNPGANSTDITIASTGSGTDSATTCNSNGCFYTKADGTIVMWGKSGAFGTGGPGANVLVTFPTTFTTGATLILTSPDDCNANNCSGNSALASNSSAASTSGMTIHLSSSVLIGGAGSNITGTIHAYWQAIGK